MRTDDDITNTDTRVLKDKHEFDDKAVTIHSIEDLSSFIATTIRSKSGLNERYFAGQLKAAPTKPEDRILNF